MNQKKIKRILSWLIVFIWMLIIFNFSNMNTTESNTKSKDTINKIVDTTITTSNKIGILEEIPTEEEKQTIIEVLNQPLRKCMHFTIFFILSLLILNALNNSNIKNKYFITFIICFIYAIADEYHQTFILGRTGQFTDVIIDTTGSILFLLIHKIYKKYKI